jgi:hypothetical protein
LAALALASGCGPDEEAEICAAPLFGRPSEETGLDASQCSPACGCGAARWEAPAFDEARIASWEAWTLTEPPPELSEDPYLAPPPAVTEGAVCAAVIMDASARSYRLATFVGAGEAEGAGAMVTHQGVCGLCSPLHDLAVYARVLDLTAPVRQCGIDTIGAGFEANVSCLEALGFSRPCAQIWAYNTAHTRMQCLEPCLALLDAPYHEADGSLNACLRCDEEMSGPVFKAIAGRTRRNTGIASALCRPCAEVQPIAHDYE